MKKFYITNENDLNENEKRTGTISYARLCDRVFNDMILCNKIPEIDASVYDNIITGDLCYYTDGEGNEYTKEEYENDEDGKIYEEYQDIYQWYIVDGWLDEDMLKENYGDELIITYSDLLDCYVLAVTHFGTSWTYVPTSIPYTTTFEA